MLATQVQYWGIQETRRHNLAAERQAANELKETQRHNIAYEGETARHNKASEDETRRHNTVWEAENQRHNIQSESISWGQLDETRRHNIAQEELNRSSIDEQTRHNIEQESIGRDKNMIDAWNALNNYDIGSRNADTREGELSVKEQEADINRFRAATERGKAIADTILDIGRLLSDSILGAWRNANGTLRIIKGFKGGVERD